MDEYIKLLHTFPLFNRIEQSELMPMLKCIGGYVKNFEKGYYIILDGNSVECVGVVLRGSVQMIKDDVWGDKSILALIGVSQIFGETFVFGNTDKSTVSFVASEDTEVLFLPFCKVLHTCHMSCAFHQTLIDNMVGLIARKNLQLTEKLEITSKKSLRTKILTYLSQQSQKCNDLYFSVPLGRVEMADYMCVDRSALTRELSRMKKEGILDFNKNTFRLYEKIT